MPMWRCPHCATPQPEASRCWVCHRSSTCCATCRHYRRSISAQLGYCGLDRRRDPLAGDEIRACWEAAAAHAEPVITGAVSPDPDRGVRTPVRSRREFVPLEEAGDGVLGSGAAIAIAVADASPALGEPAIAAPAGGVRGGPDGWTLFPELER